MLNKLAMMVAAIGGSLAGLPGGEAEMEPGYRGRSPTGRIRAPATPLEETRLKIQLANRMKIHPRTANLDAKDLEALPAAEKARIEAAQQKRARRANRRT